MKVYSAYIGDSYFLQFPYHFFFYFFFEQTASYFYKRRFAFSRWKFSYNCILRAFVCSLVTSFSHLARSYVRNQFLILTEDSCMISTAFGVYFVLPRASVFEILILFTLPVLPRLLQKLLGICRTADYLNQLETFYFVGFIFRISSLV